jgi:hypothetical protein
MGKENVAYIHNGILFNHRKKEIISFAGIWMELVIIMLSKIHQTEKEIVTCSLSYVESSTY